MYRMIGLVTLLVSLTILVSVPLTPEAYGVCDAKCREVDQYAQVKTGCWRLEYKDCQFCVVIGLCQDPPGISPDRCFPFCNRSPFSECPPVEPCV
jgi:hypothetical protein